MNKEFEKIIEKLEEAKSNVPVNRLLDDIIKDKPKELGQLMAYNKAIEIVKQEAEKYNNAIIDGKYCFQSCACTEKCDKCSRLCNGDIDWYENIDNWTEQYNNGFNDIVEIGLPPVGKPLIVTVKDNLQGRPNELRYPVYYEKDSMKGGYHWSWRYGDFAYELVPDVSEVIAWQPLPQPYQPKGE